MTTEFQKLSPNSATSAKGFTVVLRLAGGVEYSDADGTIHVDSELLVEPLSIVLYTKSRDLKGMANSRVDDVITNITRAWGVPRAPS